MIDLKIEDGKCSLKAGGSSSKLSFEIMMASYALAKTLADTMDMSFEAAALFIMQGNSFINKGLDDKEKNFEF